MQTSGRSADRFAVRRDPAASLARHRRDDETVHVPDVSCRDVVSDRADSPFLNPHGRAFRWRAEAVDDQAAPKDEVCGHLA